MSGYLDCISLKHELSIKPPPNQAFFLYWTVSADTLNGHSISQLCDVRMCSNWTSLKITIVPNDWSIFSTFGHHKTEIFSVRLLYLVKISLASKGTNRGPHGMTFCVCSDTSHRRQHFNARTFPTVDSKKILRLLQRCQQHKRSAWCVSCGCPLRPISCVWDAPVGRVSSPNECHCRCRAWPDIGGASTIHRVWHAKL